MSSSSKSSFANHFGTKMIIFQLLNDDYQVKFHPHDSHGLVHYDEQQEVNPTHNPSTQGEFHFAISVNLLVNFILQNCVELWSDIGLIRFVFLSRERMMEHAVETPGKSNLYIQITPTVLFDIKMLLFGT